MAWPKLTKNASFGPNLVVFGQKILFFYSSLALYFPWPLFWTVTTFWLSDLLTFSAQHVSTFWPWSRAGYDCKDSWQTPQKVNVGLVSNQNKTNQNMAEKVKAKALYIRELRHCFKKVAPQGHDCPSPPCPRAPPCWEFSLLWALLHLNEDPPSLVEKDCLSHSDSPHCPHHNIGTLTELISRVHSCLWIKMWYSDKILYYVFCKRVIKKQNINFLPLSANLQMFF